MDERHRQFVKNYLDGMTSTEAYQRAFDCPDAAIAASGAWRLMRNPLVRAELRRLQAEVDKLWLATREEKRAILAKVFTDDFAKTSDRIKAIEADNRMAGHDAPTEVTVNGVEALIASIRAGSNAQ